MGRARRAGAARDALGGVPRLLISGVCAAAGPSAIGEDYIDADGRHYLALLVQPVLVLEADGATPKTVRERAERRAVPVAIYTMPMFSTGNDSDNRATVRAAATAELDLVGLGVRASHRDAGAILRGVRRHPWAQIPVQVKAHG